MRAIRRRWILALLLAVAAAAGCDFRPVTHPPGADNSLNPASTNDGGNADTGAAGSSDRTNEGGPNAGVHAPCTDAGTDHDTDAAPSNGSPIPQ